MGRGTFARTKKLREASVTTKPHISCLLYTSDAADEL